MSRSARSIAASTSADPAEARVWMQAARAWLIERYPYLDSSLTSMLLVARPGLGTVAVDARWRLYYDPERALRLQQQHGIGVLAGDWIHELMHLLRDHLDRWEDLREPAPRHQVFNLAADAVVNRDVDELGLPLLEDDITFSALPPAAHCTPSMTTEEVYRRLLSLDWIDQPSDCGSGAGGGQRPWEEPISDAPDDGSVEPHMAELIRLETARKVQAAIRASGSVPLGWVRWAQGILEPSVDWRRELRSVVSRRLGQQAGVLDYTYARQSRRRVPGFTLPGMAGPMPPVVAAVIDTSGSMRPEDLALCLGDLLGLTRAVGGAGVTVLECDAEVARTSVIRFPSQVRSIELHGGGGTDMTEGLVACAGLRPAPRVVVVMTDGYTPWPCAAPAGMETAKVIALLTTDDAQAGVPDWMQSIVIEQRGAGRG